MQSYVCKIHCLLGLETFLAYFSGPSCSKRDDYMMNGDRTARRYTLSLPKLSISEYIPFLDFPIGTSVCINHLSASYFWLSILVWLSSLWWKYIYGPSSMLSFQIINSNSNSLQVGRSLCLWHVFTIRTAGISDHHGEHVKNSSTSLWNIWRHVPGVVTRILRHANDGRHKNP